MHVWKEIQLSLIHDAVVQLDGNKCSNPPTKPFQGLISPACFMEDNGPTREHGPSTREFKLRGKFPTVALSEPCVDRLPTVSASQAFQEATSFGRHLTPSGLDGLDILLQDHAASPEKPVAGGFSRGHVTEIYGPPGCGKTSLW